MGPSSTMSMKTVSPQEHKISREQFWDKNKRLNRPISPHLTIYKMQMTSVLSITHRGTGLGWSVILSGVGIGSIASNTTFPAALATLQLSSWSTNYIFGQIWFGLDGCISHLQWT